MTKLPANTSPKPRRADRKSPPNYFSRKEQLRLFALCASFMLVLVVMNEARKPSTWSWMWGEALAQNSPEPPINTRGTMIQAELPRDGFTFDVPPALSPQTDREFLTGITPALLAPIEDNSVLRARENPAWRAMFQILGEKSLDELETLSTAEVGFSQLFRQTDVYRGQLVTISGTARRLESLTPRPNEIGMESLFRWIVEPAGGSNLPIVVYSRDKPLGLEVGALREPCRVTGFCFKNWAYTAADGPRIAPLLLAKSIAWSPPPPSSTDRLPASSLLIAVVVGLAGLAIGFAVSVYRSSVRTSSNVARVRESISASLDTIDDQHVLPGVHEALDRLAEKEQ